MLWLGLALCRVAHAHAGSSQGWLHPLTGIDHLLAMIAVGAWSAQIGRRAIWLVPSAFVLCMLLGGLAGFNQLDIPGVEAGIAASVLLLGLAIGTASVVPTLIAAATVGMFGVCHGYAHGYEMPVMEDKLSYVCGFLLTTAALHLVGAVGAFYLLKRERGGPYLKRAGLACAACGGVLILKTTLG